MKKSILLLSIMLVPIMIWAQGFLRKDSIDFNENSKNEPKRSAKGGNRAHGFLDKLMNEKIMDSNGFYEKSQNKLKRAANHTDGDLGLPNNFKNGEIIDANKFNENFDYLLKRISIHKTTVDCNNGETIANAMGKYNHLIISGTCRENIDIDASKNPQSVLILEGASGNASNDKIVAAINYEATIDVQWNIYIGIKHLTISGGERGILIRRGARGNVQNSIIESNKRDGLAAWTDTVLIVSDSEIRNNGQDDWGNGIYVWNGVLGVNGTKIKNHPNASGIQLDANSTGWLHDNSIENTERGIQIRLGSVAQLQRNTFTSIDYAGIQVEQNSTAEIGDKPDGDGESRGNVFIGPFETGVEVSDNSHVRLMGNSIKCYSNTGVTVRDASSVELGLDWDRADLNDVSDPLHYSHSLYATNKLGYGNLIDGAACSGGNRDDWQKGVRVENSSTIEMSRNIIKNNSEDGVRAEVQSSIILRGGNEIRDNKGDGFEINGSTLQQSSWSQEHEPNVVENNGRDAFNINSSELHLRGGWVSNDETISKARKFIISGHRRGIAAHRKSSITLERVEIKNNSETGIDLYDGSSLNIWFDRDDETADDGILISGNGIASDPQDHDPGLRIQGGSTVSFDFLRVEGNGRGIVVRNNSQINGGWTASQSSELTYGLVLKDNKREALKIEENSSANLNYVQIENNSIDEITNDGDTWRDDTIRVQESSVLELSHSSIVDNNDTVLDISGQSHADLYDLKFENNEGYHAIQIDSSDLYLQGANSDDDNAVYKSPLVISGHKSAISASNGSRVALQRVEISNNTHRGIQISENSILNVWSGGLTLSKNGLENDGWDGFGPALEINHNSSASVNLLTVSGNGRGIWVSGGSTFNGGWKDENDTSLPTYMIVIKDNKKWGLEVQENSNLDVDNIEISGNGTQAYVNDDGSNYYEEAVQIRDSSTGDMSDGKINSNRGKALDVRNNSKFSLREMDISSNGTGSGVETYDAIQISNHSHIDLNTVTVKLNGRTGLSVWGNSIAHINSVIMENNGSSGVWSNAADISENSNISLNSSTLSSAYGNGLNVNNNSKAYITHSTIQTTYSDRWGGNAVDISEQSEVSFNRDDKLNTNTITLSATSFPLKAREGSEVNVNVPLSLTSSSNWDPVWLEGSSKLFLNYLGSSQSLTLSGVRAKLDSMIGVNGEFVGVLSQVDLHGGTTMEIWKDCEPDNTCTATQTSIGTLNCHNTTASNGQAVYRWPVVFLHGNDNSTVTNIDSDCLVVP